MRALAGVLVGLMAGCNCTDHQSCDEQAERCVDAGVDDLSSAPDAGAPAVDAGGLDAAVVLGGDGGTAEHDGGSPDAGPLAPEPLELLVSPANASVGIGGQALFDVRVRGGTPPYTYEWFRDGVTLHDHADRVSGANTSQLTLSNLTLSDQGVITVWITDLEDDEVSAEATLTVSGTPAEFAITAQPQPGATDVGGRITYSLTMIGQPPLTVRWGFNDSCTQGFTDWPTANNAPRGADFEATAIQASAVSPATFQFTTPPLVAADNGMCWGATVFDARGMGLSSAQASATVTQKTISTAPQVVPPLALKPDGTVWLLPGTDLGSFANVDVLPGLTTGNWRVDYSVDGMVNQRNRLTAARQVAVAPAVAISAVIGLRTRFVVRADGTVWSFGDTGVAGASYVLLAGIDQVSAIASGAEYVLLLRNGQVYVYGHSTVTEGGLGLGQTEWVFEPTLIPGLPATVRAISAHWQTSMALDSSGNVWAWGSWASATMTNGGFVAQTTPRQLAGLTGVNKIAAAMGSMLMVKDGAVYAAGNNRGGLPGETCDLARRCLLTLPTAQPTLASNVGSIGGNGALYARTTTGLVYAWGAHNVSGELGTGRPAAQVNYTTPEVVLGLSDAQGLGEGGLGGVTWLGNGTIAVWGSDAAHYVDPAVAPYTHLLTATVVPGFSLH